MDINEFMGYTSDSKKKDVNKPKYMNKIFIIPNDDKYKQSIKPNDRKHNKSDSISPNNNIVIKGIQSRKGNNVTSNNVTNNKQIEKPDSIVSRQAKIKAKANKNYLL
jgi:hypothetical protein